MTAFGAALQDSLRLYLRLLGMSVRSQLQYRASFLLLTTAHLAITGIEFLGVWALFDRFRHLRGWSLPEVALFYGAVNVAFALAEGVGRGFDVFPSLVKSGDFDRYLLRPRGTALQVAGQELQLFRVGRLLQGAAVLGWAVSMLPVTWAAPRLWLLAAAVAGGACLFYALMVLQATAAFWTVEGLELFNTVTYGGTETAQYPLSLYDPWFRAFFTVLVPLACTNYYPLLGVLGRDTGIPAWVPWVTPAAGALFLAAALQVWEVGVRRYHSTGS